MKRLNNKYVVITGGSRGIGKAIAKRCVQEGALHVRIIGTNQERGQQAVSELNEEKVSDGQKIDFRKANVGNKAEVQEALTDIEKVDILINNAGITKDQLLMKMREEDWDQVLEINLKSVYNTTHAVLRPMLKNSGCIINIASIVGLIGNPGQTNYAATKAALVGFTRSLAREVGSRGVRVNCIAPGFIQTDMTNRLTDVQKTNLLSRIPLARLGDTDEIAKAAIFLSSDEASYITGQTLIVDGGMTA